MMNPPRIKDNSRIGREELSEVKGIVERIADKTVEQLEKEGVFVFPELIKNSGDLDKDQKILQSENGCFRTGNVMGFLGLGDERLIIKSRFGEDNDYFFAYLLNKVVDFPNFVDLKTGADSEDVLFDYLLFLFPYYLKSAMRKGVFKEYIRREYNDSDPKGTIDVSRHIKLNTPFVGNIAYSRREFSYDNSLTELIRHTAEYIKGKPYGNRLLFGAKDEVKLIVSATPGYSVRDRQKIIYENKKNAVRHSYFKEYRSLQRLCLLILSRQKHRVGLGGRQIYGVLFDGAWLWEEYVFTLIKDRFYHPMNKIGRYAQALFDGKVGPIYPDFLSKNAELRIVADAKYKPMENISGRDYLQILAYMFRFDSKSGCFLYPEAEGAGDFKQLRLNRGSTFEDNVAPRDDVILIKRGLKVPASAASYDDFAEKMAESEREFKKIFFG